MTFVHVLLVWLSGIALGIGTGCMIRDEQEHRRRWRLFLWDAAKGNAEHYARLLKDQKDR